MKIWTPESYNSDKLPEWVSRNYENILPYITKFLTSKHPHRNGIMCPFVPKALEDNSVYFTFFERGNFNDSKHFIKKCIAHFKSNIGSGNGATIILFEESFDINELLSIHIENKLSCIRNFIMLGALYETNSAPSLHSEDYFPLRTPTPSLVMRNITSSDLAFLEPEHYSPITKAIFLTAFIRRFSRNRSQSKFTKNQIGLARQARKKQLATLAIAFLKTIAVITALTVFAYYLAA